MAINHFIMNASNELFELIQALGMQEKRHIVLYASKYKDKEGNSMLKLFNVLCRQKEYDEGEIRKKYAHERFAKNFAVSKYKLQMLIMKSLDNYHAAHTIVFEIQEMLRYFDVLFGKGLFTHCRKVILKARKLAEQHEKFPLLIEILLRERQLLGKEATMKKTEKSIEQFYEAYENALQKIKNESDYRKLFDTLDLRITQRGASRSDSESRLLEKIMNSPLLHDAAHTRSLYARRLFNSTYISYWFCQHNFKEALKYAQKQLEVFDESEQITKENISPYVSSYHNYILIQSKLRNFDAVIEHLKIFRAIPEKFKTTVLMKIKVFGISYVIETNLYLQTGRFAEVLRLENKIKDGLKQYGDKVAGRDRFNLNFNISSAYFGSGQYKNSAHWLRTILTETVSNVMTTNYGFARIFNLVIHYELQDESLLESLVRSTYRYLRKQEQLYAFERTILNFIRKTLPGVHSGEEMIHAFIGLKKELEQLEQNPYENEGLFFFDFISWLESKIEKRPFAEIVREKASKKNY